MNTVTFVVAPQHSADGRQRFTVLRLTENQQTVVSFHATMDEATRAARSYMYAAHFSGMDARVFLREGADPGSPD